jgi:hypothetical protein
LDSYPSFIEDKSEWNGTKVTFEITKKGDKTKVRFTHVGLVPDHECYGACSKRVGLPYQRRFAELDYGQAKGSPTTRKKQMELCGADSFSEPGSS